jgi:hypothetical protein
VNFMHEPPDEASAREPATVLCAACGDELPRAEAVAAYGQTFHHACYAAERFADPDGFTLEPFDSSADMSAAALEAIAARGLDVVAYL